MASIKEIYEGGKKLLNAPGKALEAAAGKKPPAPDLNKGAGDYWKSRTKDVVHDTKAPEAKVAKRSSGKRR